MAASGNEVVKLNQLKIYVKFASDEDAAAYFEPQQEFAIDFSSGDMSDWFFDGDAVIDENTITLTGKLNGAKYISYPDIVDVGTIPKQYAPTTNQSFQISRLNASGYEIGYYTLNIYTDGRLEIVAPNAGGGWCYGFQFVDTSWTFTPVSTNITGEEVLTASQLKNLIESGNGNSGGGGGGWTTVFEGSFVCEHYKSLDMFFNPNSYSQIRITAKYQRYGDTDSGEFTFNLPGLTSSETVIGMFDLSNFEYTVTGSMLYGTISLTFDCSNYSFLTYCTITKVEVM